MKMGILEKNKDPAYSPITDDQTSDSARESDDLIYDGDRSQFKTSRRRPGWMVIIGFVALLAYSTVLLTASSWWWTKERLHGANVIDCEFRTTSPICLFSFPGLLC